LIQKQVYFVLLKTQGAERRRYAVAPCSSVAQSNDSLLATPVGHKPFTGLRAKLTLAGSEETFFSAA